MKNKTVLKYGISHKDNPKEYKRLQSLNRRKNDPIGYLIRQIKYRCKIRGWDFNISKEEIEIPTHCPIFGIPLFHSKGKRSPNSYSIDRIDNNKGYVKGNCRVISLAANIRKGDLSIEQVERLLAYMKGEI